MAALHALQQRRQGHHLAGLNGRSGPILVGSFASERGRCRAGQPQADAGGRQAGTGEAHAPIVGAAG
jgi:hypothetical protein